MSQIKEYILNAESSHQEKLTIMYQLIKELAPMSEESLSWGMPTFKVKGNLVHFSDNKNHLGFYPGASGVEQFESRLDAYKHSKGAIRFPYHKDLPIDLIREIVIFRLKENLEE